MVTSNNSDEGGIEMTERKDVREDTLTPGSSNLSSAIKSKVNLMDTALFDKTHENERESSDFKPSVS